MKHLYEITDEMSQLWQMLDEDGAGLDDISDTMELLELDMMDKVSNTIKLVKHLQHDALACKVEGNRLLDRSKRIQSRIKWLTDYITTSMQKDGRPRLEFPEFVVTVRTAVQTVFLTNDHKIPGIYTTTSEVISYDKKAIKEKLMAGESVPGAELIAGKLWLDIR